MQSHLDTDQGGQHEECLVPVLQVRQTKVAAALIHSKQFASNVWIQCL